MKTHENTFQQVVPIHLIKGKDKKGNPVMKMRGIASTPSKDDDGETLDTTGFDVNYFLKYGFMNWNHQAKTDPSALIGKPFAASINKSKQLVIDFNLFSDSTKAIDVYNLQKVLEKEGLALGLSIEGDVIERGSNDKNHPDYAIVKKARITGCAVCPNPKNADTVAQIIKGNHFNSLSAYENEDEDTREKALSVGNDGAQGLAKESLNPNTKNILGVDLSPLDNFLSKKLTKAMTLKKIFLDLPTITPEKGQEVLKLIQTIEKSIHMESNPNQEVQVTDESIAKAYELLGITKSNEGGEPVVEVVTEEAPEQPVVETPVTEEVPVQTAVEAPTPVVEQVDKDTLLAKKVELEKSLQQVELQLNSSTTKSVEEPQGSAELVKGLTEMFKGHLDQMSKGIDDKFSALGRIHKGLHDQVVDMSAKMEEIDQVLSVPIRKSILTKGIVDKTFAGQEELEKAIANGDQKIISISRDKQKLCDTLTKAITSTGVVTDKQLASDIMQLESANQATPYLIAEARKQNMVVVP